MYRTLFGFTLCLVGATLTLLAFIPSQVPDAPTPPGWALITPATAGIKALNGIACTSASECWAVGSNIQRWDGTNWTVVSSPSVDDPVLNSVTCVSASDCWAVGHYRKSGLSLTLIEHWNGSAWSIVPSPNNTIFGDYLLAVTCATAADCWAVGFYNLGGMPQTLIEHWNGVAWELVPSPNQAIASNVLNAVACTSTSDCWAVGYWDGGEQHDSLIEHWDGSIWSITSAPYNGSALNSVTCTSASECWAVASSGGESGQPAVERWNGTSWTIVPSPVPGPSADNNHALLGVSCASASDCWAVGYYTEGVAWRTLIERWDGTSWMIVGSPNKGVVSNFLNAVACAAPGQCWTVGGYYLKSESQPLIEKYSLTLPPVAAIGSRKIHGNTPYDVDLLGSSLAIECRSAGATGAPGVDYKTIFTFVNNVTNCGTASIGLLSNGPGSNQCTVDLTGIANQQYVTIGLDNVTDAQNNTGNVAAVMGVLVGDVNGTGIVNASDISRTKSQTGQATTATNFRTDVNVNGVINASDISTVKSRSGTALP